MSAAVQPFVRKLSFDLALLLALLAGAGGALAQEIAFPPLSGRVVDEANLLDAATRADLDAKLAALEAKTSDQLVVVTVRSLGDRTIEEYGYRLGRNWAIGQKDKNNGVLLPRLKCAISLSGSSRCRSLKHSGFSAIPD